MLWTIVGIAIGALALILVSVAIYNGVVGSKCKKLEQKEIEEKETALRKKKGLDTPAEEEKAEEPKEEPAPAEEEKAEEPKEEPAPVEEEKAEEPKEEPAPAEEEKVEESKEEPAPAEEEKAEEPAPAKKAPAKKADKKEKKVEEKPEEDSKDAEDLLKDVPDAKDNEVEETKEEPAPVEEPKEEVKEEPAPAKKAPAKKTAAKKEPKEKVEKQPLPRKAPAKKATPTEQPTADGKWILIADKDGYYYAELKANNGQLLLTTEKYKGIAGIKGGIETIKKNLAKDNYEISVDKNNTSNFKLFGSNASLLCIGEGYTTKENAESAINSVKNFAPSQIIVSEEIDETESKKYEIAPADVNNGGKWIIVDTKDGYLHAELKANNGQVLLVTENYKGINSLMSGLDSIRKNITNGNFGVKKDKNDNYNFKLFSENKRLLALGAGYSSLASCESAINSVMRFCSSQLVEDIQE